MQEPHSPSGLSFQMLVKNITDKLKKGSTGFEMIKCSTSEVSETEEVEQKAFNKDCQTILSIPSKFYCCI